MGMGFAPTWLRQVSPPPLLHKTTLTTEPTNLFWTYPIFKQRACIYLAFMLTTALSNFRLRSMCRRKEVWIFTEQIFFKNGQKLLSKLAVSTPAYPHQITIVRST